MSSFANKWTFVRNIRLEDDDGNEYSCRQYELLIPSNENRSDGMRPNPQRRQKFELDDGRELTLVGRHPRAFELNAGSKVTLREIV